MDHLPGAPRVMLTLCLERCVGLSEIRFYDHFIVIDYTNALMSDFLTFVICRDVNVCVSMFDSLAFAFHSKFDGYGREPKIVVVTGINPKIVSGKRAYKVPFLHSSIVSLMSCHSNRA